MGLAYDSGLFQIGVILLLGSIARPDERNSEFLWQFFIAVLLTSVIFVFTPALGKDGHFTHTVATVIALRSGQWTVMDYAHPEGIITFPSFHTTCGILFAYAVRRHRWALAAFIPIKFVDDRCDTADRRPLSRRPVRWSGRGSCQHSGDRHIAQKSSACADPVTSKRLSVTILVAKANTGQANLGGFVERREHPSRGTNRLQNAEF
jgi:hypothetical protein